MLSTALFFVALMAAQSADTTRIEVGSPAVDGSVYIGDSAGRKVMRWVTLGQLDSAGTPGFELRQTFDLITLAQKGYSLTTRSGVWRSSSNLGSSSNRPTGFARPSPSVNSSRRGSI